LRKLLLLVSKIEGPMQLTSTVANKEPVVDGISSKSDRSGLLSDAPPDPSLH
jgi:hypothetical protein